MGWFNHQQKNRSGKSDAWLEAMDIVYALKRQGRTIYGFGGWSQAFLSWWVCVFFRGKILLEKASFWLKGSRRFTKLKCTGWVLFVSCMYIIWIYTYIYILLYSNFLYIFSVKILTHMTWRANWRQAAWHLWIFVQPAGVIQSIHPPNLRTMHAAFRNTHLRGVQLRGAPKCALGTHGENTSRLGR